MDLGFWSLDFGFWISLVFVLFVAAPNGAVWILDLGFWSLDFGFWILDLGFWILDFGFGLGLPCIVWILHKIFPCHADSGRRIMDSYISGELMVGFDYVFVASTVSSSGFGLCTCTLRESKRTSSLPTDFRILRWTEGQAKRGSQDLRGLPTPLVQQVFSVRLGRMEILRSQVRFVVRDLVR